MKPKKSFLYLVLSLTNVSSGLLVWMMILKVFGASKSSDAYFLTIAIIGGIQLLELMFIEQFLFFYNDIKKNSFLDAIEFFNVYLYFSLVIGLSFYFIVWILDDYLISFFVGAIDIERYKIISNLFRILSLWLVLYPILQLLEKYTNAEGYFAVPYFFLIIQNLLVFSSLLLIYFNYLELNIIILAISKIFGLIISLIGLIIYTITFDTKYMLIFQNKHLLRCVKNSVRMRFAHNIHNFLMNPITTNLLSILPAGNVSYFYYAQKAIMTVREVTIGPVYKIYLSDIAYKWSHKKYSSIDNGIKDFTKKNIVLFSTVAIVIYFLVPDIMLLINSKFSIDNIKLIQNIYLLFLIWQIIIIYELSYIPIALAVKKSKIFLIVNSLFITTFYLLSKLLLPSIGVYSLIIAGSISQLINTFLYRKYVLKNIKEHDENN